jgi:signal transduction histidine kinase
MRKDRRHLPGILAYFCAVALIFGSLAFLVGSKVTPVASLSGLAGFDYSSEIAQLDRGLFAFYPDELYAPADFASGVAAPTGLTAHDEQTDGQKTEYATYRLLLDLPPGRYGLISGTPSYSLRLFINGEEYLSLGRPAKTAEETLTGSRYLAVFFEADGPVEVIIQRANFNHYDEGILPQPSLGSQSLIAGMYAKDQLWGSVMFGCMITAFLFFFGIFLLLRRRWRYLWFALVCLLTAARTAIIDHKIVMLVLPDLSWTTVHHAEYFLTIMVAITLLLYLITIFDIAAARPVTLAAMIPLFVCALFVLVTPPLVFTRFLPVLYVVCYACCGIVLVFVVRRIMADKRYRSGAYLLTYLGVFSLFAGWAVDAVRHSFGGFLIEINSAQVGMAVFAFTNALALAYSFNRIEAEAEQMRERERAMAEENRMLGRLHDMRSTFFANLSHELRTPLAVMGGFAELTRWQIREKAVTEETDANLSGISEEAMRLAELADRMLDEAAQAANLTATSPVDVAVTLERAALLAEPIARKNDNRIVLDVQDGMPPALANDGQIRQVVLNLLTNSSRHARGGTLALKARKKGDMIEIVVADDGEGISPELLPEVFNRNVSGDGKTGLGLAISREIIETHGGAITIESTQGAGTSVRFTLPVCGKEQ